MLSLKSHQSLSKTKEEIHKEIEEIQQNTIAGLEEIKNLKIEESKRINEVKEFEIYLWEKFQKSIKDKKYFRFNHLKDLGVPFNIAIHLSSKNTGKTTEIYREMKRIIDRGEKFLYGRVYVQEMMGAIYQFEVDDLCPVMIIQKDRRWYLYKKEDIQFWRANKTNPSEGDELFTGYPRVVDLEKLGIKPVGLGYTFYNSNILGGMNYEGYSTIFFDEILSYSPMNRINKKVLDAWDASISTITRKKPDIKVYFTGNLLDVPEHPILKFYGVDVDDDLRIVRRGENGECTILFVNSGGLYGASFKHQAAVTKHGDIEHQAFLRNNKVIKTTPNILKSTIFSEFEYDTAFALDVLGSIDYVELRKLTYKKDDETEHTIYAIKCDALTITTIAKGTIFADDENIYNKFLNTTRRFTLSEPFNRVWRFYRSNNLKFDSMSSLDRYRGIVRMYREKYRHKVGK